MRLLSAGAAASGAVAVSVAVALVSVGRHVDIEWLGERYSSSSEYQSRLLRVSGANLSPFLYVERGLASKFKA
ncbi:hypothetical protein EDD16DRAFT_1646188 [Pisolithus croceorrhizus]|nr:hypothetical protein EDD16DRAFT_1646188 [Pisolithus croceorrhizus]